MSRIACTVQGEGPALVLVHGITESRRSWDPLLADLAGDHLVVAVDLRGHGESSFGDAYDPVSLATDVHDAVSAVGVSTGGESAVGVSPPIVIGHSLGGVVVSAYAAVFGAKAVVNVDQPLRLASFKDQLGSVESLLRGDEAGFQSFIAALFESMAGPLSPAESARIGALRQPRQDVVLGIWATVLESSVEELDATIDALAAGVRVPYLSLHGIDPGPEYADWLTARIPTALVEVWPDHGHYPHLVDPARFTARLRAFESAVGDQTPG